MAAPTARGALRPGIDTESQAAEVADMLFFEDLNDIVLVGTSCGGMVACRVAELARDRIGRIVLADALALFDGEAVSDHVKRPTAVTSDLATGPSREDAANRMFISLSEPIKTWAPEGYTPHPVVAMQSPVKLGSFWQSPVEGLGHLVQAKRQPAGRAPERRAQETIEGKLARAGHRPLSHADGTRGPRAAYDGGIIPGPSKASPGEPVAPRSIRVLSPGREGWRSGRLTASDKSGRRFQGCPHIFRGRW